MMLQEQDWVVLDHVVNVLRIFYDVTNEVSAESNVTVSKTTVLARIMARKTRAFLESAPDVPTDVVNLANALLNNLSDRFGNREGNELVAQCVILDPRFKAQGFADLEKYRAAHKILVGKIKLAIQNKEGTVTRETALPSAGTSSVWEEFDHALSHLQARQDPLAEAIAEVDKYIGEPLLPRTSDPLQWWESRKFTYPHLYSFMLKRLCIQATSVPCERIFSKTGQIYCERRSRLTTSKVTKMIFVHCNSR